MVSVPELAIRFVLTLSFRYRSAEFVTVEVKLTTTLCNSVTAFPFRTIVVALFAAVVDVASTFPSANIPEARVKKAAQIVSFFIIVLFLCWCGFIFRKFLGLLDYARNCAI